MPGGRTMPNLELQSFFDLGEDGWEDEINLALLLLSVLTQGVFKDKVSATPGSPAEGDVYVFDETHATEPNKIAIYDDATWKYVTPKEGWSLYNQTADYYEMFDGSEWVLSGLQPDTDGTLAANSDAKVASQKAVKTYVDNAVTGLLDFKGNIDASANPNYPAASKGDLYVITVAGKVGGASGTSVDVGDVVVAKADNAGGTEASVGASWFSIEHNGVYGVSASAASPTEVLTGTDNSKVVTPDALAALWEKGSDVASAGTVSLGEGGYFVITGTTTITDIDFATDHTGRMAWVKFAGILTLTDSATLILPTGDDIVTAAGDMALFVSEGSDTVRCLAYSRANGQPLAGGGGGGGGGTLASLTDVDVTTTPPGDGQVLVWDDSMSKWVPGDGGSGSGATSDFIGPFAGCSTTMSGPDVWVNAFGGIIQRNATGDFTFTFLYPQPNNDYTVVGNAGRANNSGGETNLMGLMVTEKTTTYFRFSNCYAQGGNYNTEVINVLCFPASLSPNSDTHIPHVGPIAGLVYNMVTPGIVNSFGITSLSRTATGNLFVTLNAAQNSLGFYVVGNAGRDAATAGVSTNQTCMNINYKVAGSPSTFRVSCVPTNGSSENPEHLVLLVFPCEMRANLIAETVEPFAVFDFDAVANASNAQVGGTLTRTATGLFTFTFDTPRANANYYFACSAGRDGPTEGRDDLAIVSIMERHANYVKLNCCSADGTLFNPKNLNGVFYSESSTA